MEDERQPPPGEKYSPTETSPTSGKFSVIIRHISYHCNDSHLHHLFRDYSNSLYKLEVKRNDKDGHSLLHAFADFHLEEDASRLIARFNGKRFQGRKLKLEKCEGKKHDKISNPVKEEIPGCEVHVSYHTGAGLGQIRVTEELLHTICSKYGEVNDNSIKRHSEKINQLNNPYDQSGYGFIYFADLKAANDAIEASPIHIPDSDIWLKLNFSKKSEESKESITPSNRSNKSSPRDKEVGKSSSRSPTTESTKMSSRQSSRNPSMAGSPIPSRSSTRTSSFSAPAVSPYQASSNVPSGYHQTTPPPAQYTYSHSMPVQYPGAVQINTTPYDPSQVPNLPSPHTYPVFSPPVASSPSFSYSNPAMNPGLTLPPSTAYGYSTYPYPSPGLPYGSAPQNPQGYFESPLPTQTQPHYALPAPITIPVQYPVMPVQVQYSENRTEFDDHHGIEHPLYNNYPANNHPYQQHAMQSNHDYSPRSQQHHYSSTSYLQRAPPSVNNGHGYRSPTGAPHQRGSAGAKRDKMRSMSKEEQNK